ncbi:MAG: ASKHA domain-containing protein, partial [Thermoguttaceae bacterium]
MRETEVAVTFQPADKRVYVLPGTRLLEAAATADLVLSMPCGGEGKCGKCRVVVSEGAHEPTAAETQALSAEELQAGCRLACQCAVWRPTTIHVPDASLFGARHQILIYGAIGEGDSPISVDGEIGTVPGDPVIRKKYLELTVPQRGDDDPDLLRLEKAIGPVQIELELLRDLPRRLRAGNFCGTAVLCDGRLLDFEPENSEWDAYTVAVDVGTTTLVAALLNANGGRDLAVAARMNPQTRFGDDVLSRILYARDHAGGLRHLQDSIVAAVDDMIGELCREAGVNRQRVYEITISGNTTMQQLLCGIDPAPLGEMPFVAATGRSLLLPADHLGFHIHPCGQVCILPVIGSFVGGDTVAGMLATGLADCRQPTLLVDIGTNGEIVLAADGRLWAASTAAGPAFEGARIAQGMRAAQGAIEKVIVDSRLHINVIGNVPPVGLCGSALVDVAAELLRHGLLDVAGRLQPREQLPAGVLPDLAGRLTMHEGQMAFCLAVAEETADGRAVLLTQRDVRELQLASGAIRAGIGILLRRAGL